MLVDVINKDATAGIAQLRFCAFCGQPFQQSGGRGRPRLFCSYQCAKAFANERQSYRRAVLKAHPVYQFRSCPVCGETFRTTAGSLKVYCSKKCTLKASRDRQE